MTTRSGNDVAFTISARDRASPVLQRVGRNVGRVQGNVVSMAGSLGTLSSATTGVLGPMGSMIGTMGAAGVAITGIGLGLSFGINRLRAMREESKKTEQAAEGLRNKLLLSGFSADNAASSVDELRGSLSRVAFQAVPGLDFAMQGFITSMDDATRTRFAEFVELLKDRGVDAAKALTAVGEALQGNFGPISSLLQRPISSFEEFADELGALGVQSDIAGSKILTALQGIGNGTVTLEEGTRALIDGLRRDLATGSDSFTEHEETITTLLGNLTQAELDHLVAQIDTFKQQTNLVGAYEKQYGDRVNLLLGHIQRATTGESTHTTAVTAEHEARIEEIEKVAPATARVVRDLSRQYAKDEFNLAVLRSITKIEFDRIKAEQTGWVDSLETDVQRAARLLAQVQASLASARSASAAAAQLQALAGQPITHQPSIPRPIPQRFNSSRQHGGVFSRPEIVRVGEVPEVVAPLSRLPSLLQGAGGPKVVQIGAIYIGDRLIARDLVIDVLNDEVSLREPSLGLG